MRTPLSLSLLSLSSLGLFACGGGGSTTDSTATSLLENPVTDLLLVLDASSSMDDEGGALVLHLETLLAAFEDPDARAGVITLDVRGRAGALVDDWVALGDDDALGKLQGTIACGAVCWDASGMASDPTFDPDAPLTQISREWLDSTCGVGAWKDGCGGGTEEGLEAIYEALCRATDDPPDSCFEDISELTEADAGTSLGMPQQDRGVLALVVSNEGDESRHLSVGESDPAEYLARFAELPFDLFITAIGPSYEDGAMLCNSGGATTWSTERYLAAAEASGLRYHAIAAESRTGDCNERIGEALEDLAADLAEGVVKPEPDTGTPPSGGTEED